MDIDPIVLKHEMTFERINEIAPGAKHPALAHWLGKNTAPKYSYFFVHGDNVVAASSKGMVQKKIHSRGLSDIFLKIPMRVTLDSRNGRRWECNFHFIFDVGLESLFEKQACRPVRRQ